MKYIEILNLGYPDETARSTVVALGGYGAHPGGKTAIYGINIQKTATTGASLFIRLHWLQATMRASH
jgi:hypothetical protein